MVRHRLDNGRGDRVAELDDGAPTDYTDSGELAIEEFCQGLFQMISGEPVELNISIKQCKYLRSLASGGDGAGQTGTASAAFEALFATCSCA